MTLLLLSEGTNKLRLFIDPDLVKHVEERDLKEVNDLVQDFRERAQFEPAELLQELSSLDFGRLVALQAGENLADYPELCLISQEFIEL